MTEIRQEVACSYKDQSCRFDFGGIDDEGRKVFIEVKNVSLTIGSQAIFPFGTGRKSSKPVSPRALNQIQIMQKLVEDKKARCIVIYITQRSDCDSIKISELDPTYREAVCEASHSGVEIIGLSVKWIGSAVYFHKFLEVV